MVKCLKIVVLNDQGAKSPSIYYGLIKPLNNDLFEITTGKRKYVFNSSRILEIKETNQDFISSSKEYSGE